MPRVAWQLGAILVAWFWARWPYRAALLVRDEGEYAHLGQAIRQGIVPYLEIYNQKTPFVFYWMAGVQSLFGESVETIRIATTLWGAAVLLLVFGFARRALTERAALWAVAGFAVMAYGRIGPLHQANAELFLLGFAAAALWAMQEARSIDLMGPSRRAAGLYLLAGGLAGLAYLSKQSAIVFAAFLCLEPWLSRRRAPAWRETWLIVSGFAAVNGVVLAYFLSLGALAAYVECTWSNNFQYVGERHLALGEDLRRTWSGLTSGFRYDVTLAALGCAGLARAGLRRRGELIGHLWLLLVGMLAMSVLAGMHYGHYFHPLILPLSLGLGAAREPGRSLLRGRPHPRRAIAILLCLVWIPPAIGVWRRLAAPDVTLAVAYSRRTPVAQSHQAAAHLKRHTGPGEPILVIGSEPQVYYYADRPASSRFAFSYPMTGPYGFAEGYRARFVADLRDHGPARVLLVPLRGSLSETETGARRFLAEVAPVLASHYERVLELDAGLAIYRRRQEETASRDVAADAEAPR